ncbi:ABC transporter permease [Lentibacillus sp. Marseille-P4043]|uniref:ABC transporter permease n=1 Tax=Lentibacillus sp. Marseille-P4043 TaxID=2040293 RepID=UPI000D0B0CEC|nr:ABC transporter permease [Lentibacillus sp. Marseille-P4043]
MKPIIETRLIHWKKHWLSILFWLLIPIVATVGITKVTDTIKDDSKVPVGIVLENETDAALELLREIKATPFISVSQFDEANALYQLKKHELDSVFVIHDDFEQKIRNSNRNRLLTSYQSDLSFAYTPVKEMILSYVQQETGRSKAAYVVQELIGHYQSNKQWTWDEIVTKSKEIQEEENLLGTSFSFGNTTTVPTDKMQTLNLWGLWAIFCLLATLLLFDWVITEQRANVLQRFAFTRYSWKNYLTGNFFLYTILFFITDLLSISLFYILFQEQISLWSLLSFRIILNLVAFLLASQFKHPFIYYTFSFAITLFVAIFSGAILPTTGIVDKSAWIHMFNPIEPFLTGGVMNLSSLIIIILAIWWYVRKEKTDA